MLNVAMDLAEAHSLPLSVIWNAIREWPRQSGSNKVSTAQDPNDRREGRRSMPIFGQ